MGRQADELRDVIAAGPFRFPALDNVAPVLEEIVKLLGKLASDPGFTGESADAAAGYAEALRADYFKALLAIEQSRHVLDQANSAWGVALRKYAEYDDPDDSIIDNGSEAVAAVLTGGFSIVLDAFDVFGDDDDDRGEDGIAQLKRDLDPIPKYEFDPNLATGRMNYSAPPDPDVNPTLPEPLDTRDPGGGGGPYPDTFDGAGAGLAIDGAGAGLAIDGPGAGISGGGGGGMHGVAAGVGSGSSLGGVGMLGAGIGAGATAAGAAAAAKLGGKGMMGGGGGGMGGGGGSEKDKKRTGLGLKAPELEEDDDKAPRSEGAGAGGRASLSDEN